MIPVMTSGEHGLDAPEIGEQRVRRRAWTLTIAITVAIIVVFALLAASGALEVSTQQPAAWRTVAGFAISAAGFALAGVGIYRLARAKGYSARTRAAMTSFPRAHRRQAVGVVRRGRLARPEAMAVTTTMAHAMVRQATAAPLWAGIVVNGLGTALRIGGPAWLTAAMLGVVALMVAGIALITYEAHLGRRWLNTYRPAEPVART